MTSLIVDELRILIHRLAGLSGILLLMPSVSRAQPQNAAVPSDVAPSVPDMPSLWDLAVQGGWFMIPIGVASIITIAFTLERLNGLRRGRILPRKLILKLRELLNDSSMDPGKLWGACEGNRSPLGNAVRAAVLKIGRPQAELENAVVSAVERETAKMTRNLRPINVVASLAPLLGLLGTVQGMIMAFMVTSTTTSTGTAKAQELAHGIYTALVTTFAGLCVAVVSVILANFLEGRIERLLREMEEIFLTLLPRLERFEGKLRVAESGSGPDGGIRVKQIHTAAAGTKSVREAASSTAQSARKLGAPRRIARPSSAASESISPERAAVSSTHEQQTQPERNDSQESKLETLRSNFDR